MHHHYRSGSRGTTPTSTKRSRCCTGSAAAARPDGPDPAPFAQRVRDALDDDLDSPGALEALDDLASAVLSGGTDASAPVVLRELGLLLGVDLSRPITTG